MAIFLKTYWFQNQEWLVGAIGRFGYSYTPLPYTAVFIHFISLLFVAVFGLNNAGNLGRKNGLIILALALANAAIIIAGFYFLSPIGAQQIFGLQGRYFIPVLFLLFLGIANFNIDNPYKSFIFLFSIVYTVIVLSYSVNFLESKMFV